MIETPEHPENYSIVCNEVARRTDLSARAKGIYYYLATLPNNWKLLKSELYNHFKEGINALNTAFKELEDAGYIIKQKEVDEKHRFIGWKYKVLWTTKKTKTDRMENLKSEIRPVGNPQLINNDKINKNKINNENKQKRKKHVFVPPSLSDVQAYFDEKGFARTAANRFYEYYSVADWKDSSGKQVRNWKQKAVAVWFKPEYKKKRESLDWS